MIGKSLTTNNDMIGSKVAGIEDERVVDLSG